MGLREKVALTITVFIIVQIVFVYCSTREKAHRNDISKQNQKRNPETATPPPIVITLRPYVQGGKTRSQPSSDKKHETIRKTFNFPDVDYPSASTPRAPFYLQETNILQRNPVQRAAEYPTSTTVQYPIGESSKITKHNNNKHSSYKQQQSPGITIKLNEFGTTPKPFCFREEGAFPEVEYPLSAREIWKPNYWNRISNIGSKGEIDNTGPNHVTPETNAKSRPVPPNKISIKATINSAITQKPKASKTKKSNDLNATPAPSQSASSMSTTPYVLTPYTTLFFDTTPSYIDTRTDEKKNTTPAGKKIKKKKKTKKKAKKKDGSSLRSELIPPEDDTYDNFNLPYSITTPVPKETSHVSNIQEITFTTIPDTGNFNKLDTCPNISNETLLSIYIGTTTPSCQSEDNVTPVSLVTIHNNEMLVIESTSDAGNTTMTENKDNKDSSYEDHASNNNSKSLTCSDNMNITSLSSREDVNVIQTNDEDFTTDVFPDFDENILSSADSSTISPMHLLAVDEAWENTQVIDPYKSISYPDELEQYYIAV